MSNNNILDTLKQLEKELLKMEKKKPESIEHAESAKKGRILTNRQKVLKRLGT